MRDLGHAAGALLLRRASIEVLLRDSSAVGLVLLALVSLGAGALFADVIAGARALGLLLAAGLCLCLLTAALRPGRPEQLRGWIALMLATGPLELLVGLSPADPVASVTRDSLLLAVIWGWRALIATRAAAVVGVGPIRRGAAVAGLASIGGGAALCAWHYARSGSVMAAEPRSPIEQAHLAAAYSSATWLLLVVPIAIAMSLAIYIMLLEGPEDRIPE